MVHAFVHPISHCEGTNTSSCAVCLPGTEKSHWRSGYADSNPEFPQTVSVILFLSFRPSMPDDRRNPTRPGETKTNKRYKREEKAKRNHTKPNPGFDPVLSTISESSHTEGIGPEASIIFSTLVG
ncbi:hypothetical protein An15g00370 [Aspergillus niger]|uniref:Uncharacterized protein n=2 Tax=Aspergillus niger TaxID=5061 RepID=A2R4G8_ASPNC|nr:hypothetical protein An15g00370 [Aspergillus niger]CAK42206.1 hypothetical protein An15g00370 [Aspergillus niger]